MSDERTSGAAPTGTPEPHEYAGDDPVRLRAQVARTRERLGDTVEELASRADVKARARRRAAAVRDRARHAGGRARHRVTGSRRGALAAGAVAAAGTAGVLAAVRHRRCGGR